MTNPFPIDRYYFSPEWKALRRTVRARDGYRCQYCGRKVGKKDLFVPTLDGADVIHPEDVAWCEANLGIDWPGFYRIGSECAKLLPKGWVHVLPPISQGAA